MTLAGHSYQALDDGPSASDSWGKLAALCLPDLQGRSFLDVGCNAGFFCGYALSVGAREVVGIDRSATFTTRARELFPEAVILTDDWSAAPQGPFDVILLASSLHYAPDPAQLLADLVARLTPGGVLVLEAGVDHTQAGHDFFPVRRPTGDTVLHAQRNTIRMVARSHGWRYRPVGPSVTQSGDPIPRYVYHLGRSVPNAWLLLQPPTFGKSAKAERLRGMPATTVISGDAVLLEIMTNPQGSSDDLKVAVAAGAHTRDWGVAYREILAAGCEAEYLARVLSRVAPECEPIIDAYFPQWSWRRIETALSDQGYNPVNLTWDHPIPLPDRAVGATRERGYSQWLAERSAHRAGTPAGD